MNEKFTMFKTVTIVPSNTPDLCDIILGEVNEQLSLPVSTLVELNEFLRIEDLAFLRDTLPYLETTVFENLSVADATYITNRFMTPAFCIDYLNQNQIPQMIASRKPSGYEDMLAVISILTAYWEQGYYLYWWS